MRSVLAIGLLFVPLGALIAADEPMRLPVPDQAKLAEAAKLVSEVFKEEYAQAAKEKRRALALKLLAEGKKTEDDPAARFVLFRVARDMAAAVGDLDTALAAIAEMEQSFEYQGEADKAPILAKAVAPATTPEAVRVIADESLAMANRAIVADQFDQATTYLGIADQCARKLKSIPMAATIRELKTDVAAAREQFGKLAAHLAALKTNPADPAANLEVGKYNAFRKRNWKLGLEQLARGSDAELKSLAVDSQAELTAATDQYQLAGRWWAVGEKLSGAERSAIRAYAADLYRAALDGLTGLPKSQAEKRIAEAGPASPGGGRRRTVNLLALIDPKQDAMRGGNNWSLDQKGLHISDGNFWPTMQIPYEPPEEYDYVISYTQAQNGYGVAMTIPAGNGKHVCWTFGWGDRCAFSGEPLVRIPNVVRAGVTQTMTLQVRKTGLRALQGGTEVARFDGNWREQLAQDKNRARPKLPTALVLGSGDASVFSKIEVVEISGPGKRLREK